FGDEIISDGHATTLTLIKQTIQGAGVIGDSFLTLDIMSGSIIDANTSLGALYLGYLDFNPTAVTNGGTIEATNGGTLFIEQNINNTGTVLASGGGEVTVFSEISG